MASQTPYAKERTSFFKKRTKKLLRGCCGLPGDSRAKSFCFFFQKEALRLL